MKEVLNQAVSEAYGKAVEVGDLMADGGGADEFNFSIERPNEEAHGDFSTNLAMVSASAQKMLPREIAETLGRQIGNEHPVIERVEVAGPGFLNLFIRRNFLLESLRAAVKEGEEFGGSDVGSDQRVQVEFVSANPTGPLHIGHGRGAAVGDSLSRILEKCGYHIEKEYYINDTGNQIETLGRSVYLRYQQAAGQEAEFPDGFYEGSYISDLAGRIFEEDGASHLQEDKSVVVRGFGERAAKIILEEIGNDLRNFNTEFDTWFSEQSLFDSQEVTKSLEALRSKDGVYEKDGALWLRSSDFDDEKDRVLVRKDGRPTYLASDVAYHRNKFQRGYDQVINIWGADHHGYIPRMKAVVQLLGRRPEELKILLVQLVSLTRCGEPISMSTRQGQFVELSEVVREVGTDATRFFLLMRRSDSQLEFDLDLAKEQSSENPVFYVQYAHARVCSVIREAESQGLSILDADDVDLSPLSLPEERSLIMELLRFPEVVEGAALNLEPHRLTHFLMEIAGIFHHYYKHHRFISNDDSLTRARLFLVRFVGTVLRDALGLLGISAPIRM